MPSDSAGGRSDQALTKLSADIKKGSIKTTDNDTQTRLNKTATRPWWPYPDSVHHSALEHNLQLHQRRASEGCEPPNMVPPNKPSPPRRSSYHTRRLSLQDAWADPNTSKSQSKDVEEVKPAYQDRDPALFNDLYIQQQQQKTQAQAQAPLKKKAQQLRRSRAKPNLKMTEAKTHRHTVYGKFNDETFGRREDLPSLPLDRRRSSLLSLSIEEEGELVDRPRTPQNSRAGSPGEGELELERRDSGYDSVDGGRGCEGGGGGGGDGFERVLDEFDFGQQVCTW